MAEEDIDNIYKQRFRELTAKLGRPPHIKDREYWELTEWLRKSYEERKTGYVGQSPNRNRMRVRVLQDGTRREDARAGAQDGKAQGAAGMEARSFLHDRDCRGCAVCRRDALSGPTLTADGSPALSEPDGPGAYSRGAERPSVTDLLRTAEEELAEEGARLLGSSDPLAGLPIGARGPGGGMVARCDGCGRMWEREKRRGRPAVKCGECR